MRRYVARAALMMLILAWIATSSCSAEPRAYRTTYDADLRTKPAIQMPEGEPPAELVIQDIVVGDGASVNADDAVLVHYVGVSWAQASQIDSSWEGGEPVRMALSEVIEGWRRGLAGMRVGGRRGLVIPPELAYRDGDTLIFVVDLHEVL